MKTYTQFAEWADEVSLCVAIELAQANGFSLTTIELWTCTYKGVGHG